MSTDTREQPASTRSVDDLIAQYDEELPQRTLSPRLNAAVMVFCFVVSLFVLRQVFWPLSQGNQYYLMWFLACVLPLVFICYRARTKRSPSSTPSPTDTADQTATTSSDNPGIIDWFLTILALITCLYPIIPIGSGGFNAFLSRQGSLNTLDVIMGAILLILVVEATRRTTGLILPVFCVVFLLYSYYGGYIPINWPGAHSGQNFDQIINALYNDASGFYGIPLDVCATYIVLFTIYGAVLDKTGAANFFIDLSFSLFKKSKAAPGRTVALSGFLLGTVSGSGTATAVSLGAVTWPVLKKAGYPKENAGGMLAASGIGAILSPPTLGAAAFIIAELLNVSYGIVLLWALIPTLLYYLGIFLAIEIDSRKIEVHSALEDRKLKTWPILKKGFYHFISLGVIVFFLSIGIAPFRAVVYATGIGLLFGLLEIVRQHHRSPKDIGLAIWNVIYGALATGIRSILPVAAVCTAAGIIVSTITKTGLGQVLANILIGFANFLSTNDTVVLILACIFSAIAVTILGLAVPVTASFIISWVIIGPALITLGIGEPAVAMFIFYYAVLSEVSPPTALAAVASAAITGGKVIPTMWQTCKYSIPAFLVPLAFTFTPEGAGLVAQNGFVGAVWTLAVSAVAVAALAGGAGGWIIGRAKWPERVLCFVAAAALLYLQPLSIVIGLIACVLAVVVHVALRRKNPVPIATT